MRIGGYDQALTDGKWFSFNRGDFKVKLRPFKPFELMYDSKLDWKNLKLDQIYMIISKRMRAAILDWEGLENQEGVNQLFDAKLLERDSFIYELAFSKVTPDDDFVDYDKETGKELPREVEFQNWFQRIMRSPASFREDEAGKWF